MRNHAHRPPRRATGPLAEFLALSGAERLLIIAGAVVAVLGGWWIVAAGIVAGTVGS